MKKYFYILSIISIIGCSQHKNKNQFEEKDREQLILDTKILSSYNDSLNTTGNFEYYEKYMLKIDEMIIKYPDPYRKNLLKVKESMKEIFEDNPSLYKVDK